METATVRHSFPATDPTRPEILADAASFALVNPLAEPMDHRTTSAGPQAAGPGRNRRRRRLTLGQCLAALLAVAGVLLPSERPGAWAAAPASGGTSAEGVLRAEGPVRLEGMQQKDQWLKRHLLDPDAPRLPFSFVFGGKPSAKLLAVWPKKTENRKLDAARTQHTVTWTDPKAGLVVRCVAVEYADYPAMEWTVYFKNGGSASTPILEEILGLDATFERSDKCEFTLHGIKGDWCAAESYEPYHLTLGANAAKSFAPASSGKSCDGPDGWPYYNLQMPGGGVILAVGWPGQWRSSFRRDRTRGLRVQAGQELTHLLLKPGEEIRTPLIAMLFWQGTDVVSAQNLWRRWYIAHNMPRVNGRPQAPVAQVQVLGTEKDIAYVSRFLEAGIRPDLCWRDAGAGGTTWYPSATGPFRGGDSWLNTGTWEIDPAHLPQGVQAVQRLGARPRNAVRPVVRAGTGGRPGFVAGQESPGVASAGLVPWLLAQRGRPGGLEVVDRSCGRDDQVARARLVPRRHERRRPPPGMAQE